MNTVVPRLAGWQATGLCLAAASAAATGGLGTLLGAVVVAPVVYALIRLRRQAPDADSTAGLVGSTLGPRAAVFTRVSQVVGYSLLAVGGAQLIGVSILPPEASADPLGPMVFNPWLWSLYAVTAIVVAAVLALALPDRVTATVATVLAAAGLLTIFYCGVAVIAHVLAGTVPDSIGGNQLPPIPVLDMASTIAILAVGLAGFEIATVHTRRDGSTGRPMGLAIGAVTVLALVVWAAGEFGGGDSPFGSPNLGLAFYELYGDTGNTIVTAGTTLYVAGALVALLWGIAKLTSITTFAATAVAMAVLAVVMIHLGMTLGHVGALILFVVYLAIVAANAKTQEDSAVAWWVRILFPIALVAMVLLPMVGADFSPGAVKPILIAALLVAIIAAVAAMGTRSPAD